MYLTTCDARVDIRCALDVQKHTHTTCTRMCTHRHETHDPHCLSKETQSFDNQDRESKQGRDVRVDSFP